MGGLATHSCNLFRGAETGRESEGKCGAGRTCNVMHRYSAIIHSSKATYEGSLAGHTYYPRRLPVRRRWTCNISCVRQRGQSVKHIRGMDFIQHSSLLADNFHSTATFRSRDLLQTVPVSTVGLHSYECCSQLKNIGKTSRLKSSV